MYVLLCANLLTASTISIPRENCSHKAPCIEYHAFMASVKSIFNFFLHKANFFKHFATLVIEVIILQLIFLIAFFIGASLASFAGCVAWRFANNVPPNDFAFVLRKLQTRALLLAIDSRCRILASRRKVRILQA